MGIYTGFACSEKKHLLQQSNLARLTVSRGIDQLAGNILETLKEWINICATYILSLDESTYINDTAQLIVFVCGVTLTPLKSLKNFGHGQHVFIASGNDISEQVLKLKEKFQLDPFNLCGLATDGAPSMTCRTNGFTKNF